MMVLVSLTENCPDTGSGCASNQASFEPSTEHSAKDRTARAADCRAFAWTDSTALLAVTLVVAVPSVAWVIVISAVPSLPDAPGKIVVAGIPLLCRTGKRCEQQSGCETNKTQASRDERRFLP
ncbi:MAG TPA: hypothetical protein VG273_06455 [Bryobacteraceae bacterium]|jgi:hypothetical protein|nr:hypothetical protein [Bryobacteraceae bacterium]